MRTLHEPEPVELFYAAMYMQHNEHQRCSCIPCQALRTAAPTSAAIMDGELETARRERQYLEGDTT